MKQRRWSSHQDCNTRQAPWTATLSSGAEEQLLPTTRDRKDRPTYLVIVEFQLETALGPLSSWHQVVVVAVVGDVAPPPQVNHLQPGQLAQQLGPGSPLALSPHRSHEPPGL
jgi:hypothetical protein